MSGSISKFKIPTILGLCIISLGIIAGVYLNFREQTFLSQAAPSLTPQNINVTNVTDDSVVISWQTSSSTTSFVTFGQNNPGEQTALDDKDGTDGPKPHQIHYVTLKNLLPKTSYQFKIVSGKITSNIERFQTSQPATNKTSFVPVIGTVLADNTPLNEGIVYLSIPGAVNQSAPLKMEGNFLIPLSGIRKDDLSDIYPLTDGTTAKLTIHTDKGEASMLFNLQESSPPLPPIRIGENLDLTIPEESPQPSPSAIKDLGIYDLNGDGTVNSADYSILSSCFGKKLSNVLQGDIPCAKTDLNEDKTVNKKDLDLMNKKFKELGVPAAGPP